jgi:hypothetical protein
MNAPNLLPDKRTGFWIPPSDLNTGYIKGYVPGVRDHIKVMEQQAGEEETAMITVGGIIQQGKSIDLVDDDQEHAWK